MRERVSFWTGVRHPWALVSLVTFFYWFSGMAMRPVIPLQLDRLGASDAQIGLITAAYPLLPLFLAIPGGRLTDRLGARRVLRFSLVGMAATGVGFSLAANPLQILGLQASLGVVELGAWLALQTLITHAPAGGFRTRQLSIFSLGWGLGLATGPLVGTPLFDRAGFEVVATMYTAFALAGIVVQRLVPRSDDGGGTGSVLGAGDAASSVRDIVGRPAVRGVLISSFITLYVVSITATFYPVFLERQGVAVSAIGVLLALIGVVSLAVRAVLPPMQARWGDARILIWGMWLAVASVAITPWLPSFWLLVPAAVALGLGTGVNPPLTVELLARHTEVRERGLVMGVRLTSNRLAQVLQPMVFGGVAAVASLGMAFPVSGVAMGVVIGVTGRERDVIAGGEP